MPIRRLLVRIRESEYARLGKSRSGDHQADRQTARGETAGHGNRGDAVHIELARIIQLRVEHLVGPFSFEGRIYLSRDPAAGGQDDQIDLSK